MKKDLIQTAKIITLGAILALGISFVQAAFDSTITASTVGWTDNTTTGNIYRETGNVGIGTSNPTAALYVARNIGGGSGFQNANAVFAPFDPNGAYGARISLLRKGVPKSAYGTLGYWDQANEGRLLLGSSGGGSEVALSVNSTSDPEFLLSNSGNVGIGTTAPKSALHVARNIGGGSGFQNANAIFAPSDANGAYGARITLQRRDLATTAYGTLGYWDQANEGRLTLGSGGGGSEIALSVNSTSDPELLINSLGNVGIGDTTPDGTLKLDVEGSIGATEYCDQNGENCTAASDIGGAVLRRGGLTMVGGEVFHTLTPWTDFDVTDADMVSVFLYTRDSAMGGEYWFERKQDGWYLSGWAKGATYGGYQNLGFSEGPFNLISVDNKDNEKPEKSEKHEKSEKSEKSQIQMQIKNSDTFAFWTARCDGCTSVVVVTKFSRR